MIKVSAPHILDVHGRPFPRSRVKARPALVDQFINRVQDRSKQLRSVDASYDAAGSSDEFKNYWAAADSLDADAANSFAVRQNLVRRSRYDIANNGYSDGIASTYATDLIGRGPTLRMQTGSEGFNRMVEMAW